MGIAASIISGLYKIRAIQVKTKASQRPQSTPEKEADRKVQIRELQKQYAATRYQLVQDLFDFTLPMSTLGYFNFNEGVLGLAGYAQTKPHSRYALLTQLLQSRIVSHGPVNPDRQGPRWKAARWQGRQPELNLLMEQG